MRSPRTAAGGRPATGVPLPPGTRVLRWGRIGVSLRVHVPSLLLGLVFVALAAAAAAVSLTLGDFPLRLGQVPAALTGRADTIVTHVVVEMRLPRALTALGVGAALGVSGALLQQLARNPLVSPDVIGINAGASAAAVLAITAAGAAMPGIAAAALAGGLGTALALYALAYRRGVTGYRLVLVGIAATALLSAATSYLLTRADIRSAERAMVWLTGSLANRDWSQALTLGVALVVLLPCAALLLRQLRLLQLGDVTAAALGGRVQLARGGLLFVATGLAAMSTAVAGPVAFVALVAPQIVQRLLRGRAVALAASAACGALLVAGADLVARTAFGGTELPVGVLTALLGAPYLLYLLARTNRIGRGG